MNIPHPENVDPVLKEIEILHSKIEILCSENANFALNNYLDRPEFCA